MTLTLLLDLDDTLLSNSMDKFIPAYLGALGKHLADYAQPEIMSQTMLAATRKMFENNRPDHTLKEVFDPAFYPKLGLSESGMREHLDLFYRQIFPSLCGLTEPRPDAVKLVEQAFERGYRVGIATNPLFPRTAIVQRLSWAGLSPQKYPFVLIPSYETFHYAKPNPAFFAEFLGKIGWPREPVVMVGNDPDHDLDGGQKMGVPVFWISEGRDNPEIVNQPRTGSGSLNDVLPWIDSKSDEELLIDYTSISAMMAVLRGAPAAISGQLENLSPELWHSHPKPGEWGPTEIACHLRDVEREVNQPRLHTIIKNHNPFIPGIDTDSWAKSRKYILQDGPQALQDYISARIETLDLLDKLDPDQWDLPARHAVFGPTDFKETVRISGSHERAHLRQLYKAIEVYRREKTD